MSLHVALLSVFAVLSLASRIANNTIQFTAAHYNILARTLGRNDAPWFLFPLVDLDYGKPSRRSEIAREFGNQHTLEDRFGGKLTSDEADRVREYEKYFHWANRVSKIVHQLTSSRFDVISLVELDEFRYFHQALHGYDAEFLKRPRQGSPDGCAIFWNTEKFESIRDTSGKTRSLKLVYQDVKIGAHESTPDRVLLAVALQSNNKLLVVVSTHLAKLPEDGNQELLRVEEAAQLIVSVTDFMRSVNAHRVVVMGDFNAWPTSWTRMVFEHSWANGAGGFMRMSDAFESFRASKGENACTSRTASRKVWIDYIFYSSDSLELLSTDVEDCPESPIPDERHPSDHLLLQAQFQL